jgi:hypothetical protein
MEQPPQPTGGEWSPVNSYGTDDPARQAEIEVARVAASEERRRDRAQLERYVAAGLDPDDAEAVIEFEHYVHDHRHNTASEHPADPAEAGEQQRRYQPRIYVTDLASHERGIQHGAWIDANQDSDEVDADIAAMLDSSPTLPALPWDQAWTVGATAEFAGLDLHGFRDTVLIAELARGVAEYGAAYAAWVALAGTDDRDQLGRFADFYVGSYDNPEVWARTVADDLAWPEQLDVLGHEVGDSHRRLTGGRPPSAV